MPHKDAEGLFRKSWGEIAEEGYTMIPNYLIKRIGALGLSPTQALILIAYLMHQWDPTNPAFPSYNTIGEYFWQSRDNVRRNVRTLEEKGLVARREREGHSNALDVDALKAALQRIYAEEQATRGSADSPQGGADSPQGGVQICTPPGANPPSVIDSLIRLNEQTQYSADERADAMGEEAMLPCFREVDGLTLFEGESVEAVKGQERRLTPRRLTPKQRAAAKKKKGKPKEEAMKAVDPDTLTADQRAAVEVLRQVPNWPRDGWRDYAYMQRWAAERPDVNLKALADLFYQRVVVEGKYDYLRPRASFGNVWLRNAKGSSNGANGGYTKRHDVGNDNGELGRRGGQWGQVSRDEIEAYLASGS